MTSKTNQRAKSKKARSQQARRRADTRRRLWWALGAVVAVVAMATILVLQRDAGSGASAPVVGGDLHSLAAADGTTLYAGGHESVSVSHDGGATWARVPSLDGADAMGWAFLGDSVWVGGHPGLSVSTDGGATFAQRNDGLPATDIHALGGSGDLLYAGSPSGLLASEDGGATWTVRNPAVGQTFMGRILVDPSDPDHAVAPDMQAGAAETRDGGSTWQALGGVPGTMWVTWDPNDVEHIVVSGNATAVASSDGGTTWTPITVPDGVSVVEMDPTDPERLFAAALGGTTARIWVSSDAGDTWTEP